MPYITLPANPAITLYYVSSGSAQWPAVLLIMGLGVQMTRWRRELCDSLVAKGFRVIRFDNRDCGLSTHCDTLSLPDLRPALRGEPLSGLPYTLETMAADSVGLLDALNIDRAHMVGASMGGAIAQIIAANYPARTLSLTSIMSSSGNPMLPPPTPAATMALFSPLPASRDRASMLADAIARHQAIASPGYPIPMAELERQFAEEYERSFYPQGIARQLGALIANGDRRPRLRTITCPTVVLHGEDDPLIPLPCGQDVADNIPHAEMRVVKGMGHDFPAALSATLVEAIAAAAEQRTPGLNCP